ncbi:hypothetical protein [Nonomuraea helvata]|uniref:Uncharacterized protein n=1 Tax=Nonomuraea helvata TaxID=37484 RepID=A0ABV5SD38_9ACTN
MPSSTTRCAASAVTSPVQPSCPSCPFHRWLSEDHCSKWSGPGRIDETRTGSSDAQTISRVRFAE